MKNKKNSPLNPQKPDIYQKLIYNLTMEFSANPDDQALAGK